VATIGDRIKEVREAKRMTQEDLATRSNLSKGFISELENGKRGVSTDNLMSIANALGATLDYLARGEEQSITMPRVVEIPHELSIAAQNLNLTYAQTVELLAAYNSVVARRSNRQRQEFNAEQWKQLHDAITKVFG